MTDFTMTAFTTRLVPPARLCLSMFAVALLICGLADTAFGQSEQRQLTTPDGWVIGVEYFTQTGDENAPVLVVVHGENSNALAWKKDIGEQFQKAGYAVVLVDLRMHGNSKTYYAGGAEKKSDTADLRPTDYPKMIQFDLETVKNFLLQEHQAKNLNVRKLGLLTSDMSVPLVLNFAELDWNKPPYDDAPVPAMRTPRGQDVRAIAIISPVLNLPPRIATTIPLQNLTNPARGVAFFAAYGKQDNADKGSYSRLEKYLTSHSENKERVMLKEYDTPLRGVNLVTRVPQVQKDLLEFFGKHLKSPDIPWMDRRSRLHRD